MIWSIKCGRRLAESPYFNQDHGKGEAHVAFARCVTRRLVDRPRLLEAPGGVLRAHHKEIEVTLRADRARVFDGAEYRRRAQRFESSVRQPPGLVRGGIDGFAVGGHFLQRQRFNVSSACHVECVRPGEAREGAGSALRLGA